MSEFWRGKRVFLTGHTGFKGAWLCKILERLGTEVTGYALEPPTEPNLYDLISPKIRSVIGDINDFSTLFAAFEAAAPEIVIHMAAQPLVLEGYASPKYTFETNVMGTVNILECVRLTEAVRSVLNVTTDKVYLNQERQRGYSEDEQLCGYDPYSNSKSCSELVTSCYTNSFLRKKDVAVSTARSGNVIGGGDFSANRLIPDCAKATARGEKIIIRNPGSVRPYQHVLDTLFAYLEIIEKQHSDASISGAFNIGPSEEDCASSGKIADLFCTAWSDGAVWEHIPTESPHESGLLKLDCAKIRKLLNWAPYWGIERAVKETAMWYKAFYSGEDANSVMSSQIEEFVRRGK